MRVSGQVILKWIAALVSICMSIGAAASPDIRLPLITPTHVTKRKMELGDWRLAVETGNFSKDVRCHLFDPKHHIIYAAGALGFHFRHDINTLGAWVKIDDGEPMRWQDDVPELTRLGVPMDGARLDNPTESIVWIPARQLDEANRIAIQPRANKGVHTFPLHGFVGLRYIARDAGCVPEGRFVP